MNASGEQRTVLVTGGSGYLAGSVIIQLLAAGRSVRTTVRDLARADEVRAILERHASTQRLMFHAADLLSDAGWDAAVEGTGQVIHVASPMPVREYRNQDLEKPAREGVRRVLEAAHRAGVRRVVVTSSTVAATAKGSEGVPSDETVWTDVSRKGVSPYARSKTLAEKDAWALARSWGGNLTLTTVLPGLVLGPALGPKVSGSLELPLRMLAGRVPLVPRVSFCGVDTRDVAELHIRALSDERAEGERIIAAGAPLWMREIAQTLKAGLGERASKVSTREAPDWLIRTAGLVSFEARFLAADLGKRRTYASDKAQAILGRPLRTLEEAVSAAGESLLRYGAV